jgi:hypothetical protein
MKTLGIKIIMGCILMASFALSAFAQTAKSTKKSKTIEKSKVPTTVTETYIVEYPVTVYETWYGYPIFNDETDWYGYDTDLYTDEYPEYYVVEFTKDGTPYKVIYSKEGKKVATHKTIMVGDVPKAVADALNKSAYKSWMIKKEREEIFRDKADMKVYKVVVEKGNEKHVLFYQEDGKLLKDKKRS